MNAKHPLSSYYWITPIIECKHLLNIYYWVSWLRNPNIWTTLQQLLGYKKNLNNWISGLLNPSNVKKKENTKKLLLSLSVAESNYWILITQKKYWITGSPYYWIQAWTWCVTGKTNSPKPEKLLKIVHNTEIIESMTYINTEYQFSGLLNPRHTKELLDVLLNLHTHSWHWTCIVTINNMSMQPQKKIYR